MTTKHNHPMVFGRKEAGCPRCLELACGAQPIRWAQSARQNELRRCHEIRMHDCQKSGCGPVCTFGDW